MSADWAELGVIGISIQRKLEELGRRMSRAESAMAVGPGSSAHENNAALVEICEEESVNGESTGRAETPTAP